MRPPESELPHLAGATAPLSDRGRSPNRDLCLCGMTSRNREAVHRHSFSTLAPFWDVELSRHHSWRHTSSATDTPPRLMDCENPAVLVLRSCNLRASFLRPSIIYAWGFWKNPSGFSCNRVRSEHLSWHLE